MEWLCGSRKGFPASGPPGSLVLLIFVYLIPCAHVHVCLCVHSGDACQHTWGSLFVVFLLRLFLNSFFLLLPLPSECRHYPGPHAPFYVCVYFKIGSHSVALSGLELVI